SDKLREEQRFLHAFIGISRFRILLALSKAGEGLTVRDLADITRGTSSSVSHQLAVLRRHGVVQRKVGGGRITYEFNADAFEAFCGRIQGHFSGIGVSF
ncbi:MAG TPA: winged helix-turn-helix domain-containing protein, partial [Burkholderiales bacterium]|nr:winged helix-turn-helix domain-containing protein [Burkholderiales bacterium]